MALHDFYCPACGCLRRDVSVPIEVGALAAEILCPSDGTKMEWIPAVGRMDAANGPGFQAFETFNGRNEKVTVTSLKQLRDIERQSEIDFKNGIGQPLVFRAFSNDPTNKDQSALHKDWSGGEQPSASGKAKFGIEKSQEAPDAGYGPGVNDSNASALGEIDG